MKTPHLLAIALASGMCSGGGLAYLGSKNNDPSASDPPRAAASRTGEQASGIESLNLTDSRPAFEDLCEVSGQEAPQVLLAYLKEANIEEVIALMEAMGDHRTQIGNLLWMVQIRGVELDPQRMISWAKSQGDVRDYLGPLFSVWAKSDPHAVLQAGIAEGGMSRDLALSSVKYGDPARGIAALRELLPHAPELKALELRQRIVSAKGNYQSAMAEALSLGDGLERKRSVKKLAEAWAKDNAPEALEWVESQENLERKNDLLKTIIDELAETQPALARNKLELLPDSKPRDELERTVVERWASRDSESALSWVKSLPLGKRRDSLYSGLVDHLPKDPDEFLSFLQEERVHVSEDSSDPLTRQVKRASLELAETSPERALLALNLHEGSDSSVFHDIATLWVNREPSEAAEWVTALPSGDFARVMQSFVLGAWADEAPEAVAAFIVGSKLRESEESSRILAHSWARKDPEAAVAWANGLSGDIRQPVWQSLLSRMADEGDPEYALQHINQIQDPATHERVLHTAIEKWRMQDPEGALGWLTNQPEEAEVADLVTQASQEWVLSNPQRASEWISGMNPGQTKDFAVVGLVRALVADKNPNKDFDSAERWIQLINDPQLHQQIRTEITEGQPQP